MKTVKHMRLSIAEGYFLDPDGLMFVCIGRQHNGQRIYRSYRGTNSLEGYHRHARDLLNRHHCNPETATLCSKRHIFAWNARAAARNRGRPLFCPGAFELLEKINFFHLTLFDRPMYAGIPMSYDHAGTGEHFGPVHHEMAYWFEEGLFRDHFEGDSGSDSGGSHRVSYCTLSRVI